MSADIAALLSGVAGPVRLGVDDLDALARAARAAGGRVAVLEAPVSKAELLDGIAAGLGFPDWWSRSWGALDELLRYPNSAPGAVDVVAWHDPSALVEGDRAAWQTARGVLTSAIADRRSRGTAPLIVALTGRLPEELDGIDDAGVTQLQQGGPAMGTPTLPGDLPDLVRRVGRVHHVAVVVRDMAAALRLWRDTLGLAPGPVVAIPADRVNIAFLPVGETRIELVEPTDETTGVARFLASRGEGFHHVCLEVADLSAALTRLSLDGIELIDSVARPGAEGPVAFLHPRSCHGVLVELIEAPGGPSWGSLYPHGFHAPGE